ncbi:MAG: DUF2914 domain-containing protein [Patescibacteria group bacterium]
MREHIYSVWNWIQKYERHLSSVALFAGFILDALTMRRVDNLYENSVLMSYFVMIAFGITALNYIEAGKYEREWVGRTYHLLPLLIQFAFGGLFSGFTVFYFRSGSIVSSWPFIVILVSLLLGNEVLKKQYERLVFQITIFFISLFFFTIFFVPVLTNAMGPGIFILSGVCALALIGAFTYFLSRVVPERIHKNKKKLLYAVFSFYILINILYFTDLIPPIPLSFKQGGVYHEITRTSTGYTATEETYSGFASLQFFKDVHIKKGDPLYVYSAVFAPNNLKTDIVHEWKHFDDETGRWISVDRIPYTIVGGADRGHRGYSMKTNLTEGNWSVNVETSRGQVIGRVTFEVIYDNETPKLEEKIL